MENKFFPEIPYIKVYFHSNSTIILSSSGRSNISVFINLG